MSELLDQGKADVADIIGKYKTAVADKQMSVNECFALVVLGVVDAIKLAEAVPGATGADKKTAVMGLVDEIATLALGELNFQSVPALITKSVIVPALVEVIHYFADKLVDVLIGVLVQDGVLKAA